MKNRYNIFVISKKLLKMIFIVLFKRQVEKTEQAFKNFLKLLLGI